MSPLHLLLRCLLIVTFCLEGSLSLWASSAMAVDGVHQVATAGHASSAAIDSDCADKAATAVGGSVNNDCDCAQGPGCACACVVPVVAVAHAVPFAAQQLLATVPAVPSRLPVVVKTTTPVFRPPIG